MGYTAVQLPPVIQRNMLENPGWYTAYTPYQPEVSRGRLESLLNFQQVTLDLTGLDIASASLLDEATAAAEAMAMAKRVSKLKSANRFFVAADVHPQTPTWCAPARKPSASTSSSMTPTKCSITVMSRRAAAAGGHHRRNPRLQQTDRRAESAQSDCQRRCRLYGAGAADGAGQAGRGYRFRFRPTLRRADGLRRPARGLFAAKDEFKRSMPGRIIGVSKDAAGNTALRMAMQTREQHIRREKANSNICTSQVLLANIASLYAVFHGPAGLKRIAGRIHRLTDILADGLQKKGLKLRHAHYFDTLCVEVADKAAVLARAEALQINLRSDIHGAVGITLDEATTREDVLNLFRAIVGDDHGLDIDTWIKTWRWIAVRSRRRCCATMRSSPIRCLTATIAKPR